MLGIIDWGIGGIGICNLIKRRLGGVPVIYFSDTGATPYGKMKRGEIADRLDTVIEFLKSKGITHLAIGCNAASTAIADLQDHGIPIVGVIDPAVAMTAKLKPASLGVIGGRRTIVSGVYRRAFAKRGIAIKQRIAQPLSGMIEAGDVSSTKLHSEAARILTPLKHCSHILLACTHYPAIEKTLAQYVAPLTKFIDPAAAVVRRIEEWRIAANGSDAFFTTGNATQMKRSAKLAFGVELGTVKKVRI